MITAITQALNAAGVRPFADRWYSQPKHVAQECLQGRSHYVDDSTLKFFNARILSARPIMGGLFFQITESTSKDPQNTARGFRVVVFDVFGETVYRPDLDALERTSTAAEKAYYRTFNIDPAQHYADKLKGKATQLAAEAAAMAAAAAQVAA